MLWLLSVAHLSVAPFLIISGKQVSGPPTGNAFHYLDFVSSSSILMDLLLIQNSFLQEF